jgi:hypothetical protein
LVPAQAGSESAPRNINPLCFDARRAEAAKCAIRVSYVPREAWRATKYVFVCKAKKRIGEGEDRECPQEDKAKGWEAPGSPLTAAARRGRGSIDSSTVGECPQAGWGEVWERHGNLLTPARRGLGECP